MTGSGPPHYTLDKSPLISRRNVGRKHICLNTGIRAGPAVSQITVVYLGVGRR